MYFDVHIKTQFPGLTFIVYETDVLNDTTRMHDNDDDDDWVLE